MSDQLTKAGCCPTCGKFVLTCEWRTHNCPPAWNVYDVGSDPGLECPTVVHSYSADGAASDAAEQNDRDGDYVMANTPEKPFLFFVERVDHGGEAERECEFVSVTAVPTIDYNADECPDLDTFKDREHLEAFKVARARGWKGEKE